MARAKQSNSNTSLVVKHAPSAAALTKREKSLLAEALRHAEQTRNVMEDSLVELGRWMLVNVFDDDAAAALDGKHDNPVWRELLERAGGPTLRLSRRLLYVGLHIASHDKRIQDDSWRLLEPGRKELLLPLREEPVMRKAAQHVVAMKLSQRATREYVKSMRADGKNAAKERITPPRFRARVRAFQTTLATAAQQRRLTSALQKLSPEDLAAVRRELSELKALAGRILADLR